RGTQRKLFRICHHQHCPDTYRACTKKRYQKSEKNCPLHLAHPRSIPPDPHPRQCCRRRCNLSKWRIHRVEARLQRPLCFLRIRYLRRDRSALHFRSHHPLHLPGCP
ncbi:unnamed protein product, partial [Ectocarpus sp. 12 AP-2014]